MSAKSEPGAADLFLASARALCCGRLRLKPRERQLALLLASESFGRGSSAGVFDVEWFWKWLRPEWRRGELKSMIGDWERNGWIAVDVSVREFRLAPDRWPGWRDCFARGGVTPGLRMPEDDLGSMVAEISQSNAAEISQRCENFAVGSGSVPNVKTFNRSDVLTNKRSTLEAAKISQDLRARVREFVGEEDWTSEQFWNEGKGWRGRIFREESAALGRALDYVVAGLRNGETTVTKTRGAMLWDQFQRERREAMRK